MTLEELNRYRKLRREIKSLEDQLETLYLTPLPSAGEKMGSKPSGVSDPTRAQALKAIQYQERLKAKLDMAEAELERIEAWMETVEDPEIRAIVRMRFIVGRSWIQTTRELFGRYTSEELARVKLFRYLNL